MFIGQGINPTVCDGSTQGLNKLSQIVRENFEDLRKGRGTILRFKLLSQLVAGQAAEASVQFFDDGGFVQKRGGTVHDEEPGGFWEGDVNAEGWCTGRDGQTDHYSVVWMNTGSAAPVRYCQAQSGANTTYTGELQPIVLSPFISDGSGLISGASSTTMRAVLAGRYRVDFILSRVRNLNGDLVTGGVIFRTSDGTAVSPQGSLFAQGNSTAGSFTLSGSGIFYPTANSTFGLYISTVANSVTISSASLTVQLLYAD